MTRIFPITGYLQKEGDPTGIHRIRREILAPLEQAFVEFDIEPVRPWKSDWCELAKRASLDGISSVVIVAYSWGAGWAAQVLARELMKLGIPVRLMVLIDPVYRPLWLPAWGFANLLGFRAIVPNSATIDVPPNVWRVVGIRQNKTVPCGHPIRWDGVTMRLPLIDSTHLTIDDSPEASSLVSTEISKLIHT